VGFLFDAASGNNNTYYLAHGAFAVFGNGYAPEVIQGAGSKPGNRCFTGNGYRQIRPRVVIGTYLPFVRGTFGD